MCKDRCICQVVSDYVSSPLAVAVEKKTSNALKLPGLFICPLRGLNASKLVHDGLPIYLVDLIMSTFAIPTGWHNLSTNGSWDFDIAEKELNDFVRSKGFKDFAEFLLSYSFEPGEFIEKLGTQSFGNFKQENHFSKVFGSNEGGICFASQSNASCTWPSMQSGYQLLVKLPPRSSYDKGYIDGWSIGVRTDISNAPNKFFKISPNSAVDIELRIASYRKLYSMSWPKIGQLCNPDHNNTDDCFNGVYCKSVYLICGCIPYHSPYLIARNANTTTCNPLQFLKCNTDHNEALSSRTNYKQSQCRPVCEETSYQMSFSEGYLDVNAVKEVNGISDEFVSSEFV